MTKWEIKRNSLVPLWGEIKFWKVDQGRTYVGVLGHPTRADKRMPFTVLPPPYSKMGLHGDFGGRFAFQWTWPFYLSPAIKGCGK